MRRWSIERRGSAAVWCCAAITSLVILAKTYQYNIDFDIGVNHGIMSLWFIMLDAPFYMILPATGAWALVRLLKPVNWTRALPIIVILGAVGYLLIDLHYWRYPSPVLEESWSDLWSTVLG